MMRHKDIRDTAEYREAEALFHAFRKPAAGLISDAAELSASGTKVVFAGTLVEALNGAPAMRICSTDVETGETRVLTFGPNVDRLPKFSPDGRQVAFLSDRHRAGDFQLYLLDAVTGGVRSTPRVDGWVEYLHWSPDGTQILLGVAGHGADISGGQGAITSSSVEPELPSWMPTVETGEESHRWRSAWVYVLGTNGVHAVSQPATNVWEATWCGNDALVAVVSSGPGEGLWYSAQLCILSIETGACRTILVPRDQMGWPAASPSGSQVAIVEALCSDRWIVAGELRIIDVVSGAIWQVDTHGIDITYTEWRSNRTLLLAGHRGFETVIGIYDASTGSFSEVWASDELTTGGRYVSVSGRGEAGDCVMVGENFWRAPEIAVIRGGHYQLVKSFDLGYASEARAIEKVERVIWKAPDGLAIDGWLLRPAGAGPQPLVMCVHGGPIGHWRPTWLGRSAVHLLMLVKRGYAVFLPNPRGSAGRGQSFARHVLGDMGGADTHDHLSGLDHLVRLGVADAKRLGVTGGSYGGFMTAWLISQDPRFAAAVPIAPVSNHVSEHLISNIPHFVSLFLADTYSNLGGRYFQRSPIMFAHKVKTPTLNVCGALDRCTPPEEAVQFHNALRENNVESVLVTYPQEGHGIRKWPAAIDFAARFVAWFAQHMPAN